MASQILLIKCPDKKGIISAVSRLLFENGYNIISNQEFVDRQSDLFYMRTEFEGGKIDTAKLKKELEKLLPEKAEVALPGNEKKRIVVMATKEWHCLGDLLLENAYGKLGAKIVAVIGSKPDLKELVEKFGLPFHLVKTEGLDRKSHEAKIEQELKKYDFEYITLAKYMRILSEEFVNRHESRIINIHHSFLPAFIGAKPYRQAFERGVKIIGATAHFVTEELDQGPIIVQDIRHIGHEYDENKMRRAGQDIERAVFLKALRLVFGDKVFVNGNKTIVFE